MRSLIALLSLLAVTSAANLTPRHVMTRRYDPAEEDENRISHFFWEDEQGNMHLEDLVNSREMRATVGAKDITFYLYTKKNLIEPEVFKANDFASFTQSKLFDKTHRTVFLVHGWNNNHKSPINTLLTDALLHLPHDLNVIVADWSTPANWNYLSAKGAVPKIGVALGEFINELMAHYKISSKTVSIMGHSLGAHVAGCAGAVTTEKLDYLIGLDPASPLFSFGNLDKRIDPSDADHVQIIHTNAAFLGFSSSIGDADYFPNGGGRQPGCGLDITGSCAHSRSYEYLAESIKHSRFHSVNCESYKSYSKGKCDGNDNSFLGGFDIDRSAIGDYYLDTNEDWPFALPA